MFDPTVVQSQCGQQLNVTQDEFAQDIKKFQELFMHALEDISTGENNSSCNTTPMHDFLETPIASLTPQLTPAHPAQFQHAPTLSNTLPPNLLANGPVTLENVSVNLDASGQISAASRARINNLISDLTDQIGGREVHAAAFQNNQGGFSLQLTPGSSNSVNFRIPNNTVYSAHTHPSGTITPSATDLANRLPNAIDAVVVNGQGFLYG